MSKHLINLLCLVVALLVLNFSTLDLMLFDRYFQIILSIYLWGFVLYSNNYIKTIDNPKEP